MGFTKLSATVHPSSVYSGLEIAFHWAVYRHLAVEGRSVDALFQ